MKTLFVSLLTFISIILNAQTDTIYYFTKLNRTCTPDVADYRVVIKKTGQNSFIQKTEMVNEKLDRKQDDQVQITITGDSIIEITYKSGFHDSRIFHRCDSGYFITEPEYNAIGRGFSRSLFPLVKSGVWKSYSKTGNMKLSEDTFEENELMRNLNWNADGSPYFSDVFAYVETLPLFKNKDASEFTRMVLEQVRYPEIAVENGIMGKVYVQFVILKDGTLDGVRVLRGVEPSLDAEAIRVVKSVKGNWTPATIRGNAVNAFMVMPVNFRLN